MTELEERVVRLACWKEPVELAMSGERGIRCA
jgi:hypothetical protein